MPTYKTNRNIRCELCNGRLVEVQNDDGSTSINLERIGDKIVCKDKEECAQNIRAEDTTYDIIVGENSIKYKCNGHDIMEVQKK